MPIYEYKCENGHLFEVVQKMSDDPVTVCEQCGAPVERVFHPVAVHFKGSGFYSTDYGSGKVAAGSSDDSGSDAKSSEDSSEKAKPEKKSSDDSRQTTKSGSDD
ncbi:MAG: FmdB family zinc ribbon protein [Solirubrobacterales bacterium]